MSCLSDKGIRLEQYKTGTMIVPWDEGCIQPASYELTFDGSLVYCSTWDNVDVRCCYDVRSRQMLTSDDNFKPWDRLHDVAGKYYIMPGNFYIASSKEYLKIPGHLMARFEGKSTLGRAGLMVHITAGYIDPGFEGNLTLEIVNVAPWPIVLRDGDKIGQLSFHTMDQVPEKLYGAADNHYQGQTGPTLPR